MYSSVILIYLLTTRRVPGYPGNELPDNGSPTTHHPIQHT